MDEGKLEQFFQSVMIKCEICKEEYNSFEKKPILICSMHHTLCQQCFNSTFQNCPFCQQTINLNKIVINRYIFELLPDSTLPNIRNQIDLPSKIAQYRQTQDNKPNQCQIQAQDEYQSNNPQQFLSQQDSQIQRNIIYFVILAANSLNLFLDFYFAVHIQESRCQRMSSISDMLIIMGLIQAISLIFMMTIGAIVPSTQIISYWSLELCIFWAVKILIEVFVSFGIIQIIIHSNCYPEITIGIYFIVQTMFYCIFFILLYYLCKRS